MTLFPLFPHLFPMKWWEPIYLILNILCLGCYARHCGESQGGIKVLCGTFPGNMRNVKINNCRVVYTKCPATVETWVYKLKCLHELGTSVYENDKPGIKIKLENAHPSWRAHFTFNSSPDMPGEKAWFFKKSQKFRLFMWKLLITLLKMKQTENITSWPGLSL